MTHSINLNLPIANNHLDRDDLNHSDIQLMTNKTESKLNIKLKSSNKELEVHIVCPT